jgi:Calcineurin-like phosphoesterase
MNAKLLPCLIALCLTVACTDNYFKHEIQTEAKPWTKTPEPATGQFTFAIIGDLNSGQRPAVFDIAALQLSLLKPKFVLSIGDLAEGGTQDSTEWNKLYNEFDARVAKSNAPFFHVGGNHDLTSPKTRSLWEQHYGRRYYHFIYEDVLFLVIDSEDYSEKRMTEIFNARNKALALLDSGKTVEAMKTEYFSAMPERITGEVSDAQSTYFENVIAQNPNVKWTFLFMHKPVWQREGSGNLERIEKALANKNYTLFNGHFHNYSYTERNGKDYIMMATTGGGQDKTSKSAFDHITLVTMGGDQPSIVNVRLDGMLDKKGHIPMGGDTLCFQASACDTLRGQ